MWVCSNIKERRLILARKKLCFKCTGGQHRASECRSNRTYFSCKDKHHISIWDKKAITLLTTNSNTVTYPVVIVSVECVKCHALIGTGAGASFGSSKKETGLNWNQNNKNADEYFKQKDTNLLSTNIWHKTPI